MMKKIIVYDNGGKTLDRYTVVIGSSVYSMSPNPNSPVGVNMYDGETGREVELGSHLGKIITKIPEEVSVAINKRLKESKKITIDMLDKLIAEEIKNIDCINEEVQLRKRIDEVIESEIRKVIKENAPSSKQQEKK